MGEGRREYWVFVGAPGDLGKFATDMADEGWIAMGPATYAGPRRVVDHYPNQSIARFTMTMTRVVPVEEESGE